eukprot:CAMPEP_0183461442 /NCGR_PEP_ID=MMETSP0370-20130417/139672_1 /TAXON_ID=268820 /ORGANISM="Peridinium aciculiferum, Strain PAER-2" /LENGTH=338 /DNA_ID=CAMNT_0025653407 /DNA_START=37 /DNA_END=1053 /DNA_ORIENTATION=+
MCDPGKGVQCDEMVNSFLSEACWGTWAQTSELPGDAEGRRALAATWTMQRGPTPEAQPGLVTYADLLEVILKLDKKELQEMKNTFAQPGNLGEQAHGRYLDLQQKLRLPDGICLQHVPPAVGEGRFFIIPAFFTLLLKLESGGRDFRVVFRTFGTDTADVIKEFNVFCTGTHPCFPDVPESMSRFVLDPAMDTGKWMRDDDGIHLTLEGQPQQDGAEQCAAALNERLFGASKRCSLALQDFFPFWRKQGESDDSGKPVFVEPLSETSPHVLFFDDNIERDRAHIVDARDASTWAALPFSQTQNVHLIKAEPISAIEDVNYFVAAVAAAEAALARTSAA